MELTQEMLDTLKGAVSEAVKPVVEERDELRKSVEEQRELIVKQGEAIQALGESFKKMAEDHDATREAVEKTVETVSTLTKFVGADGAKKSLDGEEASSKTDEKPVEKSAEFDLESVLIAALPAKYGGTGGEITLTS